MLVILIQIKPNLDALSQPSYCPRWRKLPEKKLNLVHFESAAIMVFGLLGLHVRKPVVMESHFNIKLTAVLTLPSESKEE